MDDKEREARERLRISLDQMRSALDGMTSAQVNMLNALEPRHTATRAALESLIPAWDGVSQSPHLKASLQWQVLLKMNEAIRNAVFDIDQRLAKLEEHLD